MLFRWQYSPKQYTDWIQSLLKIPVCLFAEMYRLILIHMCTQEIQNSQNYFENEEQSWRTHDFWFENLPLSYINSVGERIIYRKQGNSRKTCTSVSLTMLKSLTVWITTNCGKFSKRREYQTTLPVSWETCIQVRKQQLEPNLKQQTAKPIQYCKVK